MNDSNPVLAQTNNTPNSCVTASCDCATMWSLAQQFSTVRLCTTSGEHRGKLIRDYSVRARRIAGTYARFYLEIEDGGAPDKKGRYYWMALGAFASKTVACTFDAWQVKGMTPFDDTVWEGLGKGNFWLFCDISGWHWYRNMYPDSFKVCLKKRNTQSYVGAVRSQLRQLPWNAEALPVVKYLQASAEVIAGFEKVDAYEKAALSDRPRIQFKHLLDLANHEQGVILQPLIYEDSDFPSRIRLQRSALANWASPTIELVFSHACATEIESNKNVAPEDVHLEDFESRMKWIIDAAEQFHNLMQRKKAYMENELKVMAAWKDMPDSKTTAEALKERVKSLSRSAKRFADGVGQ